MTDLTNLSREDKLRLIEAIEEKKRRLKSVKRRFKPNPGQLDIWNCDKPTRVLLCGNGFGKTTFGVMESQFKVQGYNYITNKYSRIPCKVTIVLDKPDKVEDKWLPEIRKWWELNNEQLHKHGKPYVTEITYPNGSSIRFMFHEQDPLSFESIETDHIIFDEPPPRSVYISLLRGQRNQNQDHSTLILATPITGSWVRREIWEPWSKGEAKDTMCFKFSSRENEGNLPPGYVDWFASKLSEKEKRIRIEGDFFDLDGQALAHLFSRKVHVVEPFQWPKAWPVVVAIDPHPEKAHVCVMVGSDENNRLYAIKELSLKKPPREFAHDLLEWVQGYHLVDIVVDSLGSGDLTGGEGFKSFIKVVNEVLLPHNLRARATSWAEKQEDAFIARIQDALLIPSTDDNYGQRLPKLRFIEQCFGLISDVENVQWARDKLRDENKPHLELSNKDFLSALKYALATNIYFRKGTNEIIRTKEVPSTYSFRPKTAMRIKIGTGQRFWAKRDRKRSVTD